MDAESACVPGPSPEPLETNRPSSGSAKQADFACPSARRLQVVRGTRTSDHLDFIRGLAAVGVLLDHTRKLLFVDFGDVTGASQLTKLVYLVSSLGHQFVMVFFVLSGYFIASSVMRDLDAGRWSWTRFLTNRCVRLYVVLIPALLLTACWDRAGVTLSGDSPIYQGGGGQYVVTDIREKSSPTDLLGNAFFLQTLLVPTYGSNDPLWSLSNEFWYYMLFPCLCLIGIRTGQLSSKLGTVVIGCGIAYVCWDLLDLFPVWLMGASLALVRPWDRLTNSPWRNWLLVVAVPVFLFTLCASRVQSVAHPLVADYVLGITFAIVLYLLLHGPSKVSGKTYSGIVERLAGMSYTLYLVHVPVLAFVAAVLGPSPRWQPGTLTYAYAGGLCHVILVYAWGVSQLTEARTDQYRAAVVKFFNRLATAQQSRGVVEQGA